MPACVTPPEWKMRVHDRAAHDNRGDKTVGDADVPVRHDDADCREQADAHDDHLVRRTGGGMRCVAARARRREVTFEQIGRSGEDFLCGVDLRLWHDERGAADSIQLHIRTSALGVALNREPLKPLVSEVSASRKHHGDAVLIGRGNHLSVLD